MVTKWTTCLAGGLLLLILSIVVDNWVNTTLLGFSYSTTYSSMAPAVGGDLSSSSACEQRVPTEYRQYCGNIQTSQYGHLVTLARAAKEVPPNPYIVSLDHLAIQPCVSSLNLGTHCDTFFDSDDLNPSALDYCLFFFELITQLGIWSYVAYWLQTKFLGANDGTSVI